MWPRRRDRSPRPFEPLSSIPRASTTTASSKSARSATSRPPSSGCPTPSNATSAPISATSPASRSPHSCSPSTKLPGPNKTTASRPPARSTRMRASQCFLKSAGALKCTTCHDPHDIRTAPKPPRNTMLFAASATPRRSQPVATGRHTAQTDCIDCHMPKRRTEDIVHIVVTDHLIQRQQTGGRSARRSARASRRCAPIRTTAKLSRTIPNPLRRIQPEPLSTSRWRRSATGESREGLPAFRKALAALRSRARPEPYLESR